MAPLFLKAESTGGRKAGYYAARLVSDLANPLFIPPFVLAVAGRFQPVSTEEFSWMVGLALLFYTLIPFTMVLYMLKAGKIQSLDLPRQKARKPLFLYFIISSAVGSALLGSWFYLHRPFLTLVSIIFFLNPLIWFLLNLRWKISIHTAAVASAGAVSFVLFYLNSGMYISRAEYFFLLLPLILLPLIIWARYYLNVHSPREIIAGAAAGLLFTLIELELMIQLW